MTIEHNINLTTGEIAPLWTGYLGDSMSNCVLRYFLSKVEDAEIRTILEYAYGLTLEHIQFKKKLFSNENIPVPIGFTEDDVNTDAPRLFSDTFMLYYLRQMGIAGTTAYSMALSSSARTDIREFFTHSMKTAAELLNKSTTLLLSKGLFVRTPEIPMPTTTELVQKEGWLNGFFGDRRPLNCVEITHLYLNIMTNTLGKALMMGFAQTSSSDDIIQYTIRGRDISTKHVEVFSSLLHDDNLPAPFTLEGTVSNSTIAPFSDKLMLFHTAFLSGLGLGNYGAAIAACTRRDLVTEYVRLAAEVGTYTDDGAELMIKNGWMEKIPGAVERDALIKS